MTERIYVTPEQAIEIFCRGCQGVSTNDPTWRFQVADCVCSNCPLYPFRPTINDENLAGILRRWGVDKQPSQTDGKYVPAYTPDSEIDEYADRADLLTPQESQSLPFDEVPPF